MYYNTKEIQQRAEVIVLIEILQMQRACQKTPWVNLMIELVGFLLEFRSITCIFVKTNINGNGLPVIFEIHHLLLRIF